MYWQFKIFNQGFPPLGDQISPEDGQNLLVNAPDVV